MKPRVEDITSVEIMSKHSGTVDVYLADGSTVIIFTNEYLPSGTIGIRHLKNGEVVDDSYIRVQKLGLEEWSITEENKREMIEKVLNFEG